MASFDSGPDAVRTLLEDLDVWAVVGCSPDPSRDSHDVARFLQRHGKTVIPVNPAAAGTTILGRHTYPDLASIPKEAGVQVVDVFRRADQAGTHVDEAIALGADVVWLQLGVIDVDAAQRAMDAGLLVVMDRCPKIELPRLLSRR